MIENNVYIGTNIITWLLVLLSVIIGAYIVKNKNTNMKNFWKIMAFAIPISAIFLVFISLSPNIMTNVIEWVTKLFSGGSNV